MRHLHQANQENPVRTQIHKFSSYRSYGKLSFDREEFDDANRTGKRQKIYAGTLYTQNSFDWLV